MTESIHKMLVKDRAVRTACGLVITAFYPVSMYATTDQAGKANVLVTIENKGTCEACKRKMKE